MAKQLKASEKLKAKSRIDPETGCHVWVGRLHGAGYGLLLVDGVERRAHRIAWEEIHGEIPDGMFACHKCDNRRCVNPEHIFIGSHADNMADMRSKGRSSKHPRQHGEKHGMSRISESQAREIYWASGTHKEIGAAYGVSASCVQAIKNGRNWKYLDRTTPL